MITPTSLVNIQPDIFISDECRFLDAGAIHQLLRCADLHEGDLHRSHLVPVGQPPLRPQTPGKSTSNRRNQLITKPLGQFRIETRAPRHQFCRFDKPGFRQAASSLK